jgi:hypothetical protein
MSDWTEAYGLFDAPTVYTYHHLADVLTGGGDSHYDHIWAQLGQVGIAQAYGYGANNHIENPRVDFTRLEGIFIKDVSVYVHGGIVDGSCTATNAVTINTGQEGAMFAGMCDQFFATGLGVNLSDTFFGDNNGYGPTYKTADILNYDFSATTRNVHGTYQLIPAVGVMAVGGYWDPQTSVITNVTGPTPSMMGLKIVYPSESSPITYTGFTNLQMGQDFYVNGGNANVTLQYNASTLLTCSGQNINLGNAKWFLHFVAFSPTGVAEVCPPTQPTLASSEAVTYSATPTFSAATRASIITLTGNVTGFTLAAGADGQEKTLTFCQNAAGGNTVTAPSNVRGFFTVGTAANKCSSQHFTYSTAQAAWLADSPGAVNE